MTILFAVALTVACAGWAYSMIKNDSLQHRVEGYKALHDSAVREARTYEAEAVEAKFKCIELESKELSISQSPPTEPWKDYPVLPDDPKGLWNFAERNRDLMPVWELQNPHVVNMQPHRRYSEWATFCGNTEPMTRDKLESLLP